MRYLLIALSMLLWQTTPAHADVRVGVNIGINVSAYPELVPIPGYPVYYDPYASSNYFFYDGLYWVYLDDNWYSSDWYNGPWILAEPVYVPVFVLRVPVRYYRRPPIYFHGWAVNAAPRWGQHWGPAWEYRRSGWDHWDHRYIPRPAPLPAYQRQYSGERYPHQIEQQRMIRNEKYHYQPREGLSQRDDWQQSRLRTYPQEQTAKPQPEYYRGGQSNRSEAQDRTPELRPADNTATLQPRQGQDARAVSQVPNSQHNRFESDRMRHSQIAPNDIERNTEAGSQIPISQNNRFDSGRRHDSRSAPQANERQNTDVGSQIPISQNNRFQSDAPAYRSGPQNRDSRGARQGRGSDSGGRGPAQNRR